MVDNCEACFSSLAIQSDPFSLHARSGQILHPSFCSATRYIGSLSYNANDVSFEPPGTLDFSKS